MRTFKIFLAMVLLFSIFPAAAAAETAGDEISDTRLLWLVNRVNTVSKDFEPEGLVKSGGHYLRPETWDAWDAMLSAMRDDGVNGLYVQSTYRDYNRQRTIFRNKKTMYMGLGYDSATAAFMVMRSIAYPGASEHQTGLAVDVTLNGSLNRAFADTAAGQWVDAHCHEYGFIVRYKEEKTDITEIIYEPWHLRYVGAPHAAFMKEENLCLEEYIEYLKENSSYIYWVSDTEYYKVDYLDSLEDIVITDTMSVSSDRYGPEAWYIVTERKPYTRP